MARCPLKRAFGTVSLLLTVPRHYADNNEDSFLHEESARPKVGMADHDQTSRTKRDAEDSARRVDDKMVRSAFIQRATSYRMTLKDAMERYLSKSFLPNARHPRLLIANGRAFLFKIWRVFPDDANA